jgi:hypothetical protein
VIMKEISVSGKVNLQVLEFVPLYATIQNSVVEIFI